jgi:NADPH-dependent ferric siderophore reductase
MTQQQQQAPRRVRPKPRMTEVRRVEKLTPRCVRVTLSGPELEGFATKGPAEHVKVLLPEPGQDRTQLPEWGPEGAILREGQKYPTSRTYTPRRWDPESRELVIDFMLHGEGIASDWASRVKPGDAVAVSAQPGGSYTIDPTADWYLIAGDESALPAIGTIVEALPEGKTARVLIEVIDAAEEQDLTSHAKLDVTWLHRGESAEAGRELEKTLREQELPAGQGRVWLGCEAEIMRNIRRYLLNERGMDRSEMHTHGYWKQGASNHPDHDVGQEI